MTPSLARAYEPLLQWSSAPSLSPTVAAFRNVVEERVGRYTSADPWFEERTLAFWDRFLTCPGVLDQLSRLGSTFGSGDPTPMEILPRLRRAYRGLFSITRRTLGPSGTTRPASGPAGHTGSGPIDLVCEVSGVAFRLAATDDAGLRFESAASTWWGGLFDGTLVPTAEGTALLPGWFSYDSESTEAIRLVLADLGAWSGSREDLLDALMSLRQSLATRSRCRPQHVYRTAGLQDRLGNAQRLPYP